MQIIFEDKDLEELICTGQNRRYRKYAKDARFVSALARVYATMCSAESASKLAQFSFLHYEQLRGLNLSSVRVMNGRVERILLDR